MLDGSSNECRWKCRARNHKGPDVWIKFSGANYTSALSMVLDPRMFEFTSPLGIPHPSRLVGSPPPARLAALVDEEMNELRGAHGVVPGRQIIPDLPKMPQVSDHTRLEVSHGAACAIGPRQENQKNLQLYASHSQSIRCSWQLQAQSMPRMPQAKVYPL